MNRNFNATYKPHSRVLEQSSCAHCMCVFRCNVNAIVPGAVTYEKFSTWRSRIRASWYDYESNEQDAII